MWLPRGNGTEAVEAAHSQCLENPDRLECQAIQPDARPDPVERLRKGVRDPGGTAQALLTGVKTRLPRTTQDWHACQEDDFSALVRAVKADGFISKEAGPEAALAMNAIVTQARSAQTRHWWQWADYGPEKPRNPRDLCPVRSRD
jgi:hypothetical protein